MADDREILREIWEGRVPVCCKLSDDEVDSEVPEPIYLLVQRLSYFPLVLDKVQKYFIKCVTSDNHGEMWLEFDGQPLKWHYPVGVLFDLYGCSDDLPWNVTVHFQNFPEAELLHCSSKEVVESNFMSALKEADSLKHRSQVINNMQKKDHKQLWMGLQNDKFDQFWTVNKKLMESAGEEMFRSIPFKIYQADKSPIQKLFKPKSEEGENHTLQNLLEAVIPDVLNSDGVLQKKVVIQGIQTPLETPLLWLSEHFSHPDNFLHIVITNKDEL